MEDTEIPCQFPGCDHKVTHASEAVALVMFKTHAMSHEPMTTSTGRNSKLPPIPRPELGLDVSEEDYCSFVVKWNNFKRISGIGQDSHADQLFQCCDKDLMKLVIRSQPDIVSKGEVELLKEMKDLAVVKVAQISIMEKIRYLKLRKVSVSISIVFGNDINVDLLAVKGLRILT